MNLDEVTININASVGTDSNLMPVNLTQILPLQMFSSICPQSIYFNVSNCFIVQISIRCLKKVNMGNIFTIHYIIFYYLMFIVILSRMVVCISFNNSKCLKFYFFETGEEGAIFISGQTFFLVTNFFKIHGALSLNAVICSFYFSFQNCKI